MNSFILSNAHIVTPTEDFEGSLVIENGLITDILKNKHYESGISLDGCWLTPGCIDIHSDYLEKEVHPRPGVDFPIPFAFHFMDQRAASCGLTTLFSAVRYSNNESANRSYKKAIESSRALNELSAQGMIRHFVHARLDPNTEEVVNYLDEMKKIPAIKLVVVNENIPGQRQFQLKDLIVRKAKQLNISESKAEKILLAIIAERSSVNKNPEIQATFEGVLPLGSHDDTTIEHVENAKKYGATLSEMPTTIEAARKAKELDLWVCMGAPNYVRGGSHCGNLACKDAMAENLVDIICSDYHFPTMLTAVLKMIQSGVSPSKAINYVSYNPARFLEMDNEIGSIEIGKKADLVAFKANADFAKVSHLWVDGQLKFRADPRGIRTQSPTIIQQ